MKKADAEAFGWRPDFFCREIGGIHTSHIPLLHTPRRLGRHLHLTLQHPTPPHLTPHIDEDALEGVYFAFLTILRCLPYFLRKTRPRASYELLEAFSSSLAADRASAGRVGMESHVRIWEPGSLKVGLSITPEPAIRIRVGGAARADSRTSDSDNPNPACPIPRPPISIPPPPPTVPRSTIPPPPPTPTRPHPRAHTHAPTPNEKKFKKKLTPLFCVRIVHA